MSLDQRLVSPDFISDGEFAHQRRRRLGQLLLMGSFFVGGCAPGSSPETSATASETSTSFESTSSSSTTNSQASNTSNQSTGGMTTTSSSTAGVTTIDITSSGSTGASTSMSTDATTENFSCVPTLCLPGEENVGTLEAPLCEPLIEGEPYVTIDLPEGEMIDYPTATLSGEVVHPDNVAFVFMINYSEPIPLALPCSGYLAGSDEWECEIEFKTMDSCQNICIFSVAEDFSEGIETCHYFTPQ